ncbi:hypothetical protein QJS04_geneDACA009266 [Acorus gramineus]|uniref:Secreted protein n=1 Tax=Acorus gramineus TaxID=55184 RepID=A0AAV9AGD7_ACOGR|nr:hypothetical protein QJS04_geneDACA009266 [Acorus gramineus]
MYYFMHKLCGGVLLLIYVFLCQTLYFPMYNIIGCVETSLIYVIGEVKREDSIWKLLANERRCWFIYTDLQWFVTVTGDHGLDLNLTISLSHCP